jgi:hypothetical protein
MGENGLVGFGLIPVMDSQEYQVGDNVEIIAAGEYSYITSIGINPSVEGCLDISVKGFSQKFTASEIRHIR